MSQPASRFMGRIPAAALASARAGWAALAGLAALGGCSSVPLPQAGQSLAAAEARWGAPTAVYALPDGARQVEFALGPMSRQTWMVEADAQDRIRSVTQVLTAARIQTVRDGTPADELRRWLGTPQRRQREYMDKETWYWRFITYDCVIGAVTLSPQGRAMGGGALMPDPACDYDQ